MSKLKSALALIALSIVAAVLCFVCTVSFPAGTSYFNSVVSKTDKTAGFGGESIDGAYYGGGYVATVYPEGVISAKKFADNRDGKKNETDRQNYVDKYVPSESGALYYEKEKVCGEDNKPDEDFKASFDDAVALLRTRYEQMQIGGIRLDVADGYTVRISLPLYMSGQGTVLQVLSYTGEVTVTYGASGSERTIMPKANSSDAAKREIGYYLKGASSGVGADGTAYVSIDFTNEGKELLATETLDAASSDSTSSSSSSNNLTVKVGDNILIQLPVTEQITRASVPVSGSYNGDTAKATAIALSTSLRYGSTTLVLEADDLNSFPAQYGDLALTLLYIAIGVLFAAMLVFFFVRYHGLAFAHLYAFIFYLFPMALCIWAIPFLQIGAETVLAVFLGGVALSVSDAIAYECARKEFATGKTMTSSVKTGYRRIFWSVFDIHIALALFGFVTYFIALTSLASFAFTFALSIVFSGVCSLAVNRFAWAALMPQVKNKAAFCNYQGKEEEEDE